MLYLEDQPHVVWTEWMMERETHSRENRMAAISTLQPSKANKPGQLSQCQFPLIFRSDKYTKIQAWELICSRQIWFSAPQTIKMRRQRQRTLVWEYLQHAHFLLSFLAEHHA